MAIFDGAYIVTSDQYDFHILFMIDPNRYRATIWRKRDADSLYSIHVKTMVDKDRDRLIDRINAWLFELRKDGYVLPTSIIDANE